MTSPFTYHDAKVALEALAMFRAGECPSPTQADSALGKLHLTPGTSMVQGSWADWITTARAVVYHDTTEFDWDMCDCGED